MSGEGSPPHSRDKEGKDTTENRRRDEGYDNCQRRYKIASLSGAKMHQ
jgi:hypothetical protein